MILKLENNIGCSFIFEDIPELDTIEKIKEYLLTDPATSHLFKSKEDLDLNWKATCPETSKGCKPHGWPKGNPKWK